MLTEYCERFVFFNREMSETGWWHDGLNKHKVGGIEYQNTIQKIQPEKILTA